MRKFTRRHGRKASVHWIADKSSYTASAAGTAVPANSVAVFPLVRNGGGPLSEVAASGGAGFGVSSSLVATECTIQRVVGDFIVASTSAGQVTLMHAGIAVMPADNALGSPPLPIPGTDVDEMAYPWMWLHHFTAGADSGFLGGTGELIEPRRNIHIDVRSKRKLKGGHALCLVLLPQVGDAVVFTYLRTLVSRVG